MLHSWLSSRSCKTQQQDFLNRKLPHHGLVRVTVIICIIRYDLCTDCNKIIEEDNFHLVAGYSAFAGTAKVCSLNNTFTYVYQRFGLNISKLNKTIVQDSGYTVILTLLLNHDITEATIYDITEATI